MMQIRVLIVDDHKILREGLKKLFENSTDIVVVGEAADSGQAMEALRNIDIDLVLLDVSIPGINCEELITRIHAHRPGLPILILSMHKEAQIASRKLKAGAAGYVPKDSDPDLLMSAIRKVSAGGRYIHPDLAEQIALESLVPKDTFPHEKLSSREIQILRMLGHGSSISEIAQVLSISNKTVSTYKARLMKKLETDTYVKLIRYSIDHGLLE